MYTRTPFQGGFAVINQFPQQAFGRTQPNRTWVAAKVEKQLRKMCCSSCSGEWRGVVFAWACIILHGGGFKHLIVSYFIHQ